VPSGVGEPSQELRLERVTKRFGRVTAVDDLSLAVPHGSFFALIGASGCGKTTTLRMIAGLAEPTAGRLLLGGRDITRLRPYRRPINMVFQNYALFPHLDVFDNVAFGLRRRGVGDIPARVAEMLSLVRLAGYERRRTAELSGGEQQRVALARALVNRPRVLLLDEPLAALDLTLRRRMQIELKRLQTEVGTTFVHVTHDQEQAMTLADRVAVMNAGRVEQVGAPAAVYEYPTSAFVATLLGQSNLIAAAADGPAGDEVRVSAYGNRFALPAARCRATAGDVWLGVRPEKLHLAAAPDTVPERHSTVPERHCAIAGRVTDAAYAGASTQYLVRTAWGGELSVSVPNSGTAAPLPVASDVIVHWRPEHAFLLPRGDRDAVPA
jgi:spermidine/putrescine transport system ATP-binding protein